MGDWIDEEGYRANVGIVLMRDDGRVFLGGRTGGRGWQFPQGGIRRGEDFHDALYRELFEETGLREGHVEFVGATTDWLRYTLPRQYRRRTSVPLCIGQKQRWALLRFRADDAEVRFDATAEPPEFESFRWAEYWEPVREVVFFKQDVYRRALHELGALVFENGLPAYPVWWSDLVPTGRRSSRSPTGRRGRRKR